MQEVRGVSAFPGLLFLQIQYRIRLIEISISVPDPEVNCHPHSRRIDEGPPRGLWTNERVTALRAVLCSFRPYGTDARSLPRSEGGVPTGTGLKCPSAVAGVLFFGKLRVGVGEPVSQRPAFSPFGHLSHASIDPGVWGRAPQDVARHPAP